MKKPLRSIILLFGIFLLLWSCEKEALPEYFEQTSLETVSIAEAVEFLGSKKPPLGVYIQTM